MVQLWSQLVYVILVNYVALSALLYELWINVASLALLYELCYYYVVLGYVIIVKILMTYVHMWANSWNILVSDIYL